MTREESGGETPTIELFRRLRADPTDRQLRNHLVELHVGFGIHMAGRYGGRGVADDDLRQVALLALIKAVERFDPDRGVSFTTFAGRTIEGEVKRHFRDSTWAVRVPRPLKELHLRVRRAADDLSAQSNRSPTVRELAAYLGVTTDEIVTALGASAAYTADHIDTSSSGPDEGPAGGTISRYHDALAETEPGYGLCDDRMVVDDLVGRLPVREQEIIRLRFNENLTQAEIADKIGISQMHVSRLLRKSYAEMLKLARQRAVTADETGGQSSD